MPLNAAQLCCWRKSSSRPATQLRPPRLASPRADVPASSRLAQRWGEWAGPRRDPKAVLRPHHHCRKWGRGPGGAWAGSEWGRVAGTEEPVAEPAERVRAGQCGGRVRGRTGAAPGAPRSEGEPGGGFHLPAGRSGRRAGSGALRAGCALGAGPGSLRRAPRRSAWGRRGPAGPAAPAFVSSLRHTAGAGSWAASQAGRAWVGCARWSATGLRECRFPGSAARWGRAGGTRPERCGIGPGGLRPPVAVRGVVRVNGRTAPCWLRIRFWLEKRL